MLTPIEKTNIRRNFITTVEDPKVRTKMIRLARMLATDDDEGTEDEDDFLSALYHVSRPENRDEFERLYEELDADTWAPEEEGRPSRRANRRARQRQQEGRADG